MVSENGKIQELKRRLIFELSPMICNLEETKPKSFKFWTNDTNFIGQPVLSQLLKLMNRDEINIFAEKSDLNYYTKRLGA